MKGFYLADKTVALKDRQKAEMLVGYLVESLEKNAVAVTALLLAALWGLKLAA